MWAAKAIAKIDIPLPSENFPVIKAGTEITITHGRDEKYALWADAIYDLPEEYVGDIIMIYSNS